jgi:hypothetical protein
MFKEVDRFIWKGKYSEGKTDGNIKRIPNSSKLHEIIKEKLQNIQISKQSKTISCKIYLNITFNAETLTLTTRNKRKIQKMNTTFGEKLRKGKKGENQD